MISPQERAQAASGACPHRVIDEIYFGLRLRRLSRFHFSAHDAVFCAIHDVHLGFAGSVWIVVVALFLGNSVTLRGSAPTGTLEHLQGELSFLC